jgi:hypothetical protein
MVGKTKMLGLVPHALLGTHALHVPMGPACGARGGKLSPKALARGWRPGAHWEAAAKAGDRA